MSFKFENLRVWQTALELSGKVDGLTKKFPRDEIFILGSQIKRASDSVVLNIAEGSTLQSDAEFKRFLIYANRSALEVVACIFVGKQRNIIIEEDFKFFYDNYEKLIAMIQALIKTLQ